MYVVFLTAELIVLLCILKAIMRSYDAGCVLSEVMSRHMSETIKRFLNCKCFPCLQTVFHYY